MDENEMNCLWKKQKWRTNTPARVVFIYTFVLHIYFCMDEHNVHLSMVCIFVTREFDMNKIRLENKKQENILNKKETQLDVDLDEKKKKLRKRRRYTLQEKLSIFFSFTVIGFFFVVITHTGARIKYTFTFRIQGYLFVAVAVVWGSLYLG